MSETFEPAGASPGERQRATRRATFFSVGVNTTLALIQLAAGVVGRSNGLVADGLHSLSDLVADFIVLLANRHGSHPADRSHPYGHGRFETAATLALAVLLILLGVGLAWGAAVRLLSPHPLLAPAAPTLFIAFLTLIFKEALFRYLRRAAKRYNSAMLMANAWHTRSDALSSFVVLIGIGASLAGWPWMDGAASLLVGLMILRMGGMLGFEALAELVDTALDMETVAAIRATLLATPGVLAVHELRTRKMASSSLVDAHVQVAPHISVSEGHYIAETARRRVVAEHGAIDALVHIDPEDDAVYERGDLQPDRMAVLAHLNRLLVPVILQSDALTLHYLDGQLHAEVRLSPDNADEAAAIRTTVEGQCPTLFASVTLTTVTHKKSAPPL